MYAHPVTAVCVSQADQQCHLEPIGRLLERSSSPMLDKGPCKHWSMFLLRRLEADSAQGSGQWLASGHPVRHPHSAQLLWYWRFHRAEPIAYHGWHPTTASLGQLSRRTD